LGSFDLVIFIESVAYDSGLLIKVS